MFIRSAFSFYITFFNLLFLLVIACIGGLFVFAHRPVMDFSLLEQYDPGSPSLLIDDEEREWGRFQLDRRQPIALFHLPDHAIQAFVAAEDWKFFHHGGLSWKGILRSMLVNLYHGRIVQGASTITQQLVKLLFLDGKRVFSRKIKEQWCAVLVERQFTKEHILETYLNHICFGCGIYGVEAASQRFWGISVRDISIDQAAMLAGIVRAPSLYCPLVSPLSACKRRNLVLKRMVRLNFIEQKTCDELSVLPVNIRDIEEQNCAPHVRETIRIFLENMFGKEKLYAGGLRIKTTLNMRMQQKAQHSFKEHIHTLHHDIGRDIDGAMIAMNVKTGDIKALVGGYDFIQSKFNRALQAKRQEGSVFKPVIYATAIDSGMSLLDSAIDEPISIDVGGDIPWRPYNYNRLFEGSMTLARALSYSNNIIAVKVALAAGLDRLAEYAKKFHLCGDIKAYPALALGCLDSTAWDVVGMFNVFANGGVYVEPTLIKWVKNKWGKKVYKSKPKHERVIAFRTSSKVTHVLTIGMERRRRMSREWIDSQAASKTGTASDSRTCWFAGSTPEITTVVYVGSDDSRPMGKNVYPLATAYPIWLAFHKQLSTTKKHFSYDPDLRSVSVNWKTGSLSKDTKNKEVQILLV